MCSRASRVPALTKAALRVSNVTWISDRAGAMRLDDSRISRAGASSTFACLRILRCEVTSNTRRLSISSPNNSIRTGASLVRGKHVQNAPAPGELAGARHGIGRLVAHAYQPLDNVFDVYGLLGLERENVGHQVIRRAGALQDRLDSTDHDAGLVAGEGRQRADTLADDAEIRNIALQKLALRGWQHAHPLRGTPNRTRSSHSRCACSC